MADKEDKATPEELAEVRRTRKIAAQGAEHDKAREQSRADELASQKAVEDAVFGATHDKDGDPIALGVDLHEPPGITLVEGKP
jgi:hypothetical protein